MQTSTQFTVPQDAAVRAHTTWSRVATRVLKVAGFCAFMGIVMVLGSELVARLFIPSWAPQTARLASFWRYDAAYGWSHNPGATGHFAGYGFDTAVAINGHGFRGREIDYRKPDGVQHVVVLGDSFVWGFGVEQHEAFTHLLDDSLQPGTRVINLGVSGYSTDQELLLYRDRGRRYEPDVVVLVFANNDIIANNQDIAYGIYGKPAFRIDGSDLRLTNQPVPQAPWYRRLAVSLASRSYVISEANRVRQGHRSSLRPPSGSEPSHTAPPPFPRNTAEELSLRLIARLRREVEADGAHFVLLLVDQLYRGVEFREALAARHIPAIALDDFTASADGSIHIADRLHWNARGHRLVAQVLLSHLTTHALLAPAPETDARRPDGRSAGISRVAP